MINGIYLSTMGALAQSGRHATISNNLANVNTSGFKPDWSRFRAIPAENVWHPERRILWDEILAKTGGGVWNETTATNLHREGPFQQTGNLFDLALHDDPATGAVSFFAVQPSWGGDVRFTRAGHFIVGDTGELLTPTGDRLLDIDGDPIVVDQDWDVHVREDGVVAAVVEGETVPIAQIAVVATTDHRGLTKVGDNLFELNGAEWDAPPGRVRSGYVEQSATHAVEEMVNMIEASRVYEANMKFVTMQDDTLGQTVRRIAAVSA